ncbi:VWA domain-containing protein [Nitrosophilus labii]|uniref:VWA domain-containing protein n=1 Tax=Nitrosophilus labii TaxID=2706014 RepID=UPI001656EDEA|nr:VWA domain-containing protein [Nitrosophilus labii]
MKILSIEFIYLMLIPSLVLLYLIITNKSELDRIFDKEVLNRLKIDMGMDKNTRLFLLFLALFLMIFALSRPVIQKGVVEIESKKTPVVLALDISKSMLAEDLFPNRLEFAKRKMEEFIKKSKDLEISLIAFAKDAFIVSPLSSDKEAILFLLKNIDTTSITLQGTNFLSALETASMLLGKESIKNMIIFTDGGDKEDFSREINYAKKSGLKIFMLAFGSEKGAPIPEDGRYIKDKNQNIVITKLNKNVESLALETDGEFIVASSGVQDITKLLNSLKNYKKKIAKQKVTQQIELYPYFLAVALFLLFIVFFSIPSRKKITYILLVSFVLTTDTKADIFDFKNIKKAKEHYDKEKYEKAIEYFEKVAKSKKSSQSFYDLANAYYKSGKYEKAIKYYNLVQTPNKRLRRYVFHNLGNSYFMLKDYKKAIEFYKKALAIEYDKDTEHNLELAKKMLKKSNQKGSKKENKNKKKNNENKEGRDNKKSDKEGKRSKKGGDKSKEKKKIKGNKSKKDEPISQREEKKWLKMIQNIPQKTLIYKNETKNRGDFSEKPW